MTIFREEPSELGPFTIQHYGGAATFVLQVVAGGEFAGILRITTTDGLWASGILEWLDGPSSVDGDLIVVWDLSGGDDLTHLFGPGHRVQDEGNAVDAVPGSLDYANSSDKLGQLNDGALSAGSLASSSPSAVDPPTLGTVYVSRLNLNGRDYKLKTWAFADDEPDPWTLEPETSTGSEPTTAGRPGFLLNRLLTGDADTIDIHLFCFSDDPAVPAPLFVSSFFPRGRAPEGRRRSLQA